MKSIVVEANTNLVVDVLLTTVNIKTKSGQLKMDVDNNKKQNNFLE